MIGMNSSDFVSKDFFNCTKEGIKLFLIDFAAATCIAVGITSLDD